MQVEQVVERPPAATLVRRIEPSRGAFALDLPEIWRYRELVYFLIWRDIKARYRQTVLGAFWAVIRPFVQMVVFTIIFSKLAGINAPGGTPYPLFVYPGLLVWTYFTSALSGGSSSVAGNGGLITKAYFPRIYIPFTAVLAPLVDFALSFVVLAGLFAWYRYPPSWQIVFLPFFLFLTIVIAFGLSLWLAPLTVRYRDVPYALPFLLQIWMYVTPVIYPITLVPAEWQWVLALNPMTGVVSGARWSLIGGAPPTAGQLLGSIVIGLGSLAVGFLYFRRREPTFADFI